MEIWCPRWTPLEFRVLWLFLLVYIIKGKCPSTNVKSIFHMWSWSSFLSTKRRKVLEGSGCHSVFHCLEECLYHSRFFLKRIIQKINIWLVAQLTTKQMNKELIIKIHYKVLPCALTFHSYCKHISEKLALQVNKNTVYRFTLTGKYVWLEPSLLPTCHD